MGSSLSPSVSRKGCTKDLTAKLVSLVLKDCDASASLIKRAASGDLSFAAEIEFPVPKGFDSSIEFAKAYQVYNLLRKNNFLELGYDREAAAVEGFVKSESRCRDLNLYGYGNTIIDTNSLDQSFEAILHIAKEKISRLLGPFDLDSAAHLFSFSAGASSRLPRKTGAPFYKFRGLPHVTSGCALLAICDIWRTPLWRSQMQEKSLDPENWVKKVPGSIALTVPKSFKTDRMICKEPEMNMRVQRGIGGLIRRKLKTVGIDLDDQGRNQYLALVGSRTGSLATIDLSAASDSISLHLVEDLLPPDWYEYLFMSRSHFTRLRGKYVKLQKISSMGNGYTFELESLIFWAISQSVLDVLGTTDRRLAVYGDDIIVHHSAAGLLVDVLDYVGFSTNIEKSFVSGPFRESCGKHYFYGHDVTPFFVKESIASEDRYYWFLNSYRQWLLNLGLPLTNWLTALKVIKGSLNRPLCVVPPGFGFTAGLEEPIDRARVYFSLQYQGYVFQALIPRRKKHRPNGVPALLSALEYSNFGAQENCLELAKGEVKFVRLWRRTSRWPSLSDGLVEKLPANAFAG